MMQNLWWIGVRRADIEDIKYLFKGAIVVSGKNIGEDDGDLTCISLEGKEKMRINVNDSRNDHIITNFYLNNALEVLKEDANARFLWYGEFCSGIPDLVEKHSPFNNPKSITGLLSDKLKIRALFSKDMNVLPSVPHFGYECDYDNLCERFPGCDQFVIQAIRGSGGNGTILVKSKHDPNPNQVPNEVYLVSRFFDEAISVNTHIIVGKHNVSVLSPSLQILDESESGIFYVGGDFPAADRLEASIKNEIVRLSKVVGEKIRKLGYRGVAGIDFLVNKDNQIYFIEINPRFQASTATLNRCHLENRLPSVQQMHIDAFTDTIIPEPSLSIRSGWSVYAPLINGKDKFNVLDDDEGTLSSPDPRQSSLNKDSFKYRIFSDNAVNLEQFDCGTNPWRLLVQKQIIGVDHNNRARLLPVISRMSRNESEKFVGLKRWEFQKVAFLKFELFTYGAKISKEALENILHYRKDLTIRDGIAGGLEIVLFDDIYVNVPIKEGFSFLSPYTIEWESGKGFWLSDNGRFIVSIKLTPQPSFVGEKTGENVDMKIVGQLFTDRLGISPFYGCKYNYENNLTCGFCEIGLFGSESKLFGLDEVEDVLNYCLENEKVNMKHILISGGTPRPREWQYLVDTSRTIRKRTDMKLYIMIEPPGKEKVKTLFDAGVDEVGFNLEVFDREIAKKIMPGKGLIPIDRYYEDMDYAVSLWGRGGAIRSILIVGLEEPESTIKGVEALVERGVMPILSPFRPIPETRMANFPPPSPDLMYDLWKKAQHICEKNDMTLGPLCICCQNNTITFPVNDKYRAY